jgi:uncharacterized protein (TIGR04255 family)
MESVNNAPLVYVLAQIKFNPILLMGEAIPQLQDVYRKMGLIKYEEKVLNTFKFSNDAPTTTTIQQWHFSDSNNTHKVILGTDSMTLEATSYRDHHSFFDLFFKYLNSLESINDIAQTTRIGLRYIDLITSKGDDNLNDYMINHFLGYTFNGVDDVEDYLSLSQYQAATKQGQIRVNCTQYIDGSKLPKELLTTLTLNKQLPIGVKHNILDIDHFKIEDNEYNEKYIRDVFMSLHKTTSQIFKGITTDHAKDVWGLK